MFFKFNAIEGNTYLYVNSNIVESNALTINESIILNKKQFKIKVLRFHIKFWKLKFEKYQLKFKNVN